MPVLSDRGKGVLSVVICGTIAGSSGILIKMMHSLDATSIAWLRMTIPTVALGLWMKYRGIPFFRGNMKVMLSASLLNASRMCLFFLAYIYTSIGNAVIMCYTWPLFVALLGAVFLKEKLTQKQVWLMFLAFVGLMVAYSDKPISFEDRDFIGMMAALGTSFMYAITVIIYKSESNNYERNEIIFYQNLMGMFLYLPFFIKQYPYMEPNHIGLGCLLGLLIGIIGFNFFFYGLKVLKASIASSIMYLEIVGAIFLSWVFFGDFLSPSMIIGGLIILISSFLISR